MSTNGAAFPIRLKDALVQLTPERPDAIEELRALYTPDMVFRDPIPGGPRDR